MTNHDITTDRHTDLPHVCGATDLQPGKPSCCSLDRFHTGRHLDVTYGYFGTGDDR